MSNASDAVRGILSLLKILVQSEREEGWAAILLHMLVEELSDQALHWQPAAGGNKRPRLRPGPDGASGSRFPTWSWAAWEPVKNHSGGVRHEVPFRSQTVNKGAPMEIVLDDTSEALGERMRPLIW